MQFDVFISYSSHDKSAADATCAALEQAGIRCWIAPRDILPGADWSAALMDALESCRAMVLIFSSNANSSPQIRREVERVVGRGIPVIPVRIEDTAPTKAMAYFMGPVHWLDALTPPLEQHLHKLADSLKTLLAVDNQGPAPVGPAVYATASRAEPIVTVSTSAAAPVVASVKSEISEPPKRLLILKCATWAATAIGALLCIGAILGKQMGWLPTVGALTFVSYWLVYRNLTSQPTTAKVSGLCAGLVWAYLAVWNSEASIIFLVIVEGIAAACLLYVAAELARAKS
jgi:TIR domain-containing protein